MTAWLSGGNERPAGANTPGAGFGAFALVRDRLSLNVTYRNLLSPATLAHIHGPASVFGTANVLVDLAPFNGGVFGIAGSLAGTTVLAPSNLLSAINGATYVNVHTTNYPGGEIRGQIQR
jgi:hypothetical protein